VLVWPSRAWPSHRYLRILPIFSRPQQLARLASSIAVGLTPKKTTTVPSFYKSLRLGGKPTFTYLIDK
jgi:hypothetical protein